MIIEIIIIYIVYLAMLILGTYYVNLYLSKDSFTKDELKDVLPYLTKLWSTVMTKYSMSIMLICLGVASLFGVLLPLLSQNWFLNSGIIFIVMFLSFPLAIKNFNMARITTGGTFYDTAMNIFVNNSSFILIGFGTGTATGLMYNWGVYKEINFLWFMINFLVLSVMIGIVIKDLNKE